MLPGGFIPIAEENGLIADLGLWVLNETCRQAAEWRASGLVSDVAVNLSPVQARQPDLVNTVGRALEAARLPPDCLELEITENLALDLAGGSVVDTLREIAQLGVRLSIDDFGSGYSSLAYLRVLPVTSIKIDRSIIAQIGCNSEEEAVIDLGHSLGRRVVAEGVETAEQVTFLCEQACDEGQGFLLGAPLPPVVFESMLRRQHSQRG
jgi:EAL domain-containing protein (putative c-di-GMP-specific phosphodiesterase class I)